MGKPEELDPLRDLGAQQRAIESPESANVESRELLAAFDAEVQARAQVGPGRVSRGSLRAKRPEG